MAQGVDIDRRQRFVSCYVDWESLIHLGRELIRKPSHSAELRAARSVGATSRKSSSQSRGEETGRRSKASKISEGCDRPDGGRFGRAGEGGTKGYTGNGGLGRALRVFSLSIQQGCDPTECAQTHLQLSTRCFFLKTLPLRVEGALAPGKLLATNRSVEHPSRLQAADRMQKGLRRIQRGLFTQDWPLLYTHLFL